MTALGVLATCLLATSAAEAQLFPNLPIRRERVPCPEELPVYGLYRNKYYGYYPTCWRQFAPGWGCPNHEAPDWEAELAKRPLDIPDEELGGYGGYGDEGLGGLGGSGDEMLPALPERRSPFELDSGAPSGSPFDTPPSDSPFDNPPPGVDSPPPSRPSPFDLQGSAPTELPPLEPPANADRPASTAVAGVDAAPTAGPELAVLPEIKPPIRPASASATAAPVPSVPGTTPGSRVPSPQPPIGMIPEGGVALPPGGILPADGMPVQVGPAGAMIPAGGVAPGAALEGPVTVPGDPLLNSGRRPRRGFLSGLLYGRNLRN